MSERRAMFIGRYQPFHKGHEWLIRQKLDAGVPVLIAVRDIEPDPQNPLTTAQTIAILRAAFAGEDAVIIAIPDIESVNYGRGVGYQIIEHVPPADIATISATEIRRRIMSGDQSWRDCVPERAQQLVELFLSPSKDGT